MLAFPVGRPSHRSEPVASTRVARWLAGALAWASLAARGGAVPAQDRPLSPGGSAPSTHLIRSIDLVDVERGELVADRDVLIIGERIVSVAAANSRPAPEGAVTVDGEGLYLLPGLFDAHVHYTSSPDTYGPLLLAHGVTCVRDTGSATSDILRLREELRKPDAKAPEIVCTGAIIDGDLPVWPFSEPCDTPEEATAAVRKLHEAGVDQIKVYSLLKPDVYLAAVEEAHRLNRRVTGHVPNEVSIDEAIAAGQDCVEHLVGLEKKILELAGPEGDEGRKGEERESIWAGFSGWYRLDDVDPPALNATLARLAEAKMTQCPTLVVMAGIGRAADLEEANADPRMEYVPHSLRAFWSGAGYAAFGPWAGQAVPHMQRLVGLLHQAGVPLLVGTDLANPYVFAGSSVHDEMRMFQEAGIPAADVLRAATIAPAAFCGKSDHLGSVAEGKAASLVLVRGNPLDDVAHAREIEAVFRTGTYYDRAALDAMLADVKAVVKATQPGQAEAIDLAQGLPGEIVHRGTYRAKFGQFPAGEEDFVIARTADGGYILKAHSRMGGFQPDSLTTFTVGPDFAFRGASWEQFAAQPVLARYEARDGHAVANATADGEAQPEHSIPLPPNAIIAGPTYSSDFLTVGAANVAVGETKSYEVVSFGYPTWRLLTTRFEIAREADTTHAFADGAKVPARFYRTKMTSPMGEATGQLWTTVEGVPLKSVLKIAYGEVTAALDAPATP